ncbi:hypothetical protein [Nocardiopsis sp. NPDC055824]
MTGDEGSHLLDVWLKVNEFANFPALPHVAPEGSDLFQDDALAAPFSVSGGAHNALVVAQDHWQVLRSSLHGGSSNGQQVVNLYLQGQFSLVRGALENAARAVWILGPDERTTRVSRRLALKRKEYSNLKTLRSEEGQPDPDDDKRRLAKVSQADQRVGVSSEADYPSYRKIMKEAGRLIPGFGEMAAFSAWSRCSGLAHGDETALVNLETTAPPSWEGVGEVQVDPSVRTLSLVVWAAGVMFERGTDLCLLRSRV